MGTISVVWDMESTELSEWLVGFLRGGGESAGADKDIEDPMLDESPDTRQAAERVPCLPDASHASFLDAGRVDVIFCDVHDRYEKFVR